MIEYTDIFDISLPCSENRTLAQKIKPCIQSTVVSLFTIDTHARTHRDVLRHVEDTNMSIDTISLHHFLGPCRVLDMTHVVGAVTADDISLESIHAGERILLKTKNSIRGYRTYYDSYVSLSVDGARWLVEQGVLLVGVDSLFMQTWEYNDENSHAPSSKRSIPMVEGLDLSAVEPGVYSIAVLPLRMQGSDIAFARAVLLR
jgi:arylformamidase